MSYYITDQVTSKRVHVYTVGYFLPSGEWYPVQDFESLQGAAWMIHYLNGGVAPFGLLSKHIVDQAREITEVAPE